MKPPILADLVGVLFVVIVIMIGIKFGVEGVDVFLAALVAGAAILALYAVVRFALSLFRNRRQKACFSTLVRMPGQL